MHAAVRRYSVSDAQAFVGKIEEGEFTDRLKEVDGFVGYYVIRGGNGDIATVTVGETDAAISRSAELAAEQVKETASDLVDGSPEVTSGEVMIRAERPWSGG
jgi:hypothetical protein